MRRNEFSLQLDEATTSTSNKDAYLICYVRFIDNDGNIVEDLLFCKPILKNCRAHELFAMVYARMAPQLCLAALAGCER